MRNALLSGLVAVAGVALVLLGVDDMRTTGRTGSPWLVLGLFPALLAPFFALHYLGRIRAIADLRSGRTAIERWTVAAGEFERFCEQDRRIPPGSIETNYYRPPQTIPAAGLEVIFADDGVLIGGGYFRLSLTGGRRLESVRHLDSDPPTIEFTTALRTTVRTSSATMASRRTLQTLRVPVAADARAQALRLVERFQSRLAR